MNADPMILIWDCSFISLIYSTGICAAGPPRAKADFGVKIASDESDRELAALRNFPYGSINMLALRTHEGEQFIAGALRLRAKQRRRRSALGALLALNGIGIR